MNVTQNIVMVIIHILYLLFTDHYLGLVRSARRDLAIERISSVLEGLAMIAFKRSGLFSDLAQR